MRCRYWLYTALLVFLIAGWYFLLRPHPNLIISQEKTNFEPEGGIVNLEVGVNHDIWPVEKVWAVIRSSKTGFSKELEGDELSLHLTMPTERSFWVEMVLPANIFLDGQSVIYEGTVFAKDRLGHISETKIENITVAGRKALALSADKQALDARLSVWDLTTGKRVRELRIRQDPDNSYFLPSPDFSLVAAETKEAVLLIDFQTKAISRIPIAGTPICFSTDGKKLIILKSGRFFIYTTQGELLQTMDDLSASPIGEAYIKDIDRRNGRIIYQPDDYHLEVFDLWQGKQYPIGGGYYGGPDDKIKNWTVSADCSTVALLFHYSTPPGPNWVTVWDVKTHRQILTVSSPHGYDYSNHPPHEGPLYYNYLDLSWDGQWLWTNFEYWNIPKGEYQCGLDGFEEPMPWSNGIFSPKGKCLRKDPQQGIESLERQVFDQNQQRVISTILLTEGYSDRDYYFTADDRYLCLVETHPSFSIPDFKIPVVTPK